VKMKDGYPCGCLCDRFLFVSLYLFVLVCDDYDDDECFAGKASEETSKILFVATTLQCLHVCFLSDSFSISFSFFQILGIALGRGPGEISRNVRFDRSMCHTVQNCTGKTNIQSRSAKGTKIGDNHN
jgi:hypothetical protein